MEKPRAQEIYRHFKGKLYQVITLATDTETGAEMVVYQALYGNYHVFCRPLDMFMSKVDRSRYPDVTQKMRFELISPEDAENHQEKMTDGEKDALSETGNMQDSSNASVSGHIVEYERSEIMEKTVEEEAEELNMNPKVVKFLDANTARERLHILGELHADITDDMIDVMSMAIDTEINPGDIDERYDELKECLTTLGRFEADRLRNK